MGPVIKCLLVQFNIEGGIDGGEGADMRGKIKGFFLAKKVLRHYIFVCFAIVSRPAHVR